MPYELRIEIILTTTDLERQRVIDTMDTWTNENSESEKRRVFIDAMRYILSKSNISPEEYISSMGSG